MYALLKKLETSIFDTKFPPHLEINPYRLLKQANINMNRRSATRVRRRKSNRRGNNSNQIMRSVYAVVAAGNTAECNVQQLKIPGGRSIRVTRIVGTACMLEGPSGFIEVVLYNQGQTQVKTTSAIQVTSGRITRYNLTPPQKVDMWIDAGNTNNSSYKIAHFDFPCISKLMASFKLLIKCNVYYRLGQELADDKCPSVMMTRVSAHNYDCINHHNHNDAGSQKWQLIDDKRRNNCEPNSEMDEEIEHISVMLNQR